MPMTQVNHEHAAFKTAIKSFEDALAVFDGRLSKYITGSGDSWTVHAESGRELGHHKTEADAKRQLAAIEANKHKEKAIDHTGGCPACGEPVNPGNKYCSWECGSKANKFKCQTCGGMEKDLNPASGVGGLVKDGATEIPAKEVCGHCKGTGCAHCDGKGYRVKPCAKCGHDEADHPDGACSKGDCDGYASNTSTMGDMRKAFGPCMNPSCDNYGQPHENCHCYGELKKDFSMDADGTGQLVKSFRSITPGTMENAIAIFQQIAKDGGEWVPVVGPRGAPGMRNTKTGQIEYGHNAERMAHVREFGDLRFGEEGKKTETNGQVETNHMTPEYQRVKDLPKPHGHNAPETPIDRPHNKPHPVAQKGGDFGEMPNNPIAPATAPEP